MMMKRQRGSIQKKTVSLLLSAAVLFTPAVSGMSVGAAEPDALTQTAREAEYSGVCGAYLTWTLKDGLLTISGVGKMENYSNVLHAPWYDQKDAITSVVIQDGATSMGDFAFYGCERLTGITIPDSVTSIGNSTLDGCMSLAGVTIPDSVTSIKILAFNNCKSLTSITIPESVTSVDKLAFVGCDSLTEIQVAAGNPAYASEGGVLFNKDQSKLIRCPGGKTGGITIKNGVTSIEERAFSGCAKLTHIMIPDSVTSIGSRAFWNCKSLAGVTIPASVTSMGDSAFDSCSSLTHIAIPDSLTSIGNEMFMHCTSLTSVSIGNSVTSIGKYAFYGSDSLANIFYAGAKTQWDAVEKENAKIPAETVVHYNTMFHADTGILVSGKQDGALPKGTTLKVSRLPESTEEILVYEINLITKEGQTVQPVSPVQIRVPIPAGVGGAAYKVYRLEADGSKTDVDAAAGSGYLVITTDSLGKYTIERPSSLPGDLDGSGEVTIQDVMEACKVLARQSAGKNPTSEEMARGDLDGDGKFTITDVMEICKILARKA